VADEQASDDRGDIDDGSLQDYEDVQIELIYAANFRTAVALRANGLQAEFSEEQGILDLAPVLLYSYIFLSFTFHKWGNNAR
jgi:hypothetical protein